MPDAGRKRVRDLLDELLRSCVSWPRARTLEAGAEVDGRVLGKGTYKVSDDGKTLTVTAEGMGLKGPFKTVAVFEKVVPDPYAPQAAVQR